MGRFTFGALALLATAGSPVFAAPAKGGSAQAAASKSDGLKAPPNFDAIMSIFDKLFPAQPDPDPARLALARTSVAAMWPDGAYGHMMTSFAGGMIDRVMQMKKSDLPDFGKAAGKAPVKTDGADLSVHDQAAAKDPYFDQRVAAIRAAVVDETSQLSAIIDPRVRDGMARSLARRFDARQLTDINNFFATPSGHAFAGQSMQLWFDPDMLHAMMSTFPEMMKRMPDMMKKVKEANDRFPAPPSAKAKAAKAKG